MATQTEIELKLCRDDFKFFLSYMYRNFYRSHFDFHEFHVDLINRLLGVKAHDRVILNAPPRIGKTEILKHYIAWHFLENPKSSFLYISYDKTIVESKNGEIKEMMEWLSDHFGLPELMPKSSASSKAEWVNEAGGTVIARGANNAITGRGCDTKMIIDDPNKPEDRNSVSMLNKRIRVFTSTIRNRINLPSVPILLVQQRVASLDLTGFLSNGGSGDDWTVWAYDAINKDGTALCPERLPVSEVERYRNDPFTYWSQYRQKPLDDLGRLFAKQLLVRSDERVPSNSRYVVSVFDTDFEDIGNKLHGIVVMARSCVGNNYYVVETHSFKADISHVVQLVLQLRMKYGLSTPVIFQEGSPSCALLRESQQGILKLDHVSEDELIGRATLVKYLFDQKLVKFNLGDDDDWSEVCSEFTTFPYCINRHIVTATVLGLWWLRRLPPERVKDPMEGLRFKRKRMRNL